MTQSLFPFLPPRVVRHGNTIYIRVNTRTRKYLTVSFRLISYGPVKP